MEILSTCESFTEDLPSDASGIALLLSGRARVHRVHPAGLLQIETGFSLPKRLLSESMHAVTARGFELKVFLFVVASSIDGLLSVTTGVIY